MATKNDRGIYDCYAKAADDEPLFILRANDPLAPMVVDRWAELAQDSGVELAKVQEARVCAVEMRDWKRQQESARAGQPDEGQ